MARHALAFLLALSACTASHRPEPPSLPGTWVFDSTRITELYEVSTTPEGPERDRALARAHVHHGQLRVEFTAEEATLVNGAHRRSLPYRVRAWHGPVVQVEGLQGDRVVVSTLKIDHDRLTWFDRDGEIELVLRRDAP